MPTRALLAAVALTAASLTGCNPAGKLLGKWEADMSHFQAQVEKSGNPMAGALASMMSLVKVEAEFKSDGTCTIGGSMLGQEGRLVQQYPEQRRPHPSAPLPVAQAHHECP